jgi:hypothetical protein
LENLANVKKILVLKNEMVLDESKVWIEAMNDSPTECIGSFMNSSVLDTGREQLTRWMHFDAVVIQLGRNSLRITHKVNMLSCSLVSHPTWGIA